MISLRINNKSYRRRTILTDSLIELPSTGFFMIEGANGSGKSTMLRILRGTEGYSGTYMFDGKEPSSDFLDDNIDLVTPSSSCLMNETVMENMLFLYQDNDKEKAEEILRDLGLDSVMNQKAGSLSVGERRRMNIAIAVYGGKRVLLIDEPLVSIDEDNQKKLLLVLLEYSKDHLVFVSNHEKIPSDIEDKIRKYQIENSKAVISGFGTDDKRTTSEKRSLYSPFVLIMKTMRQHLFFFLTLFLFLSSILGLVFTTSFVGSNSCGDYYSKLVFESVAENTDFMFAYDDIDKSTIADKNGYFESIRFDSGNWNISGIKNDGSLENGNMNGILYFKDEEMKAYEIIYGTKPISSSEILIPSTVYDYLLEKSVITGFSDISNKTYIWGNPAWRYHEELRISGVYQSAISYLNDSREEVIDESLWFTPFQIYGEHFGAVSVLDKNIPSYAKACFFSNSVSYAEYKNILNAFQGLKSTENKNQDIISLVEYSKEIGYIGGAFVILLSLVYFFLFLRNIEEDLDFVFIHFGHHKRSRSSYLFSSVFMQLIPCLFSLIVSVPAVLYLQRLINSPFAVKQNFASLSFNYKFFVIVLIIIGSINVFMGLFSIIENNKRKKKGN